MLYFILFSAFLTVLLFVCGLETAVFSSRKTTLTRLDLGTSDAARFRRIEKEEKPAPGKRLLQLTALLGNLIPKSNYLKNTRKKLATASVLMKPEEFLGICILVAAGLFVCVLMITQLPAAAVVCIPIGFFLPEFLLEQRKRKRMSLLNAQLPETLGILANGLRAGFSFTQAMSIAVRDMNPPISEEFSRVLRENSLGKSLDESLCNLAERNEDDDLTMVVTALLIQRQVGGNLSEILDTIANTIRERVRIKGEIKTLTAQGRLSAAIISLLPTIVALILLFLSPEYILTLFRYPMGIGMVVVGIIMQLIGIYAIFKLVDVKV